MWRLFYFNKMKLYEMQRAISFYKTKSNYFVYQELKKKNKSTEVGNSKNHFQQ